MRYAVGSPQIATAPDDVSKFRVDHPPLSVPSHNRDVCMFYSLLVPRKC